MRELAVVARLAEALKIGFLPLAPERVFNHIDPLKG